MSKMSDQPRVKRGSPPQGKLNESNYRKRAFAALRRDFEDRCAYSDVHISQVCESEMTVDHHDPSHRQSARGNRYSNLFLATNHCNKAKGAKWPSGAERKLGLRFLDCTKEQDFGSQIFEDPKSHKWIGTTKAARYHILHLGLNDSGLITQRRERSDLWAQLQSSQGIRLDDAASWQTIKSLCETVDRTLKTKIRPIPPPPPAQTEIQG